jgi:O-antigen ligase
MLIVVGSALAMLADHVLIFCGLLLLGCLVVFAYQRLDRVLLITLSMSILLSIDIAFKQEPFPRIGPTRFFVAALLVAWSFRLVSRRMAGTGLMVPRRFPLGIAVLFYACTVLISTAMSIAPRQSYFAACVEVIQQFALFYLIVDCLRLPSFWVRWQRVLFATTGVVCAFAFAEEVAGSNVLRQLMQVDASVFRGGIMRVRSTFFHPIALGCFLDMVFPFVLVEVVKAREKAKKILLLALLLGILVTALLTVSRMPWLALLLEVGVFLTWWAWRDRRHVVLLVVYALALVVGVAFVRGGSNRVPVMTELVVNPSDVSTGRLDKASSEYYRIALVNAVIDRLQGARWLFGLGPGVFQVADVEGEFEEGRHVLTAPDSHYVRVVLEGGVLGLLAFVVLLIAALRACARTIRAGPDPQRITAVACLAAIVGVMVNNVTASMFSLLPLNLLFWSTVALAASIPNQPAYTKLRV